MRLKLISMFFLFSCSNTYGFCSEPWPPYSKPNKPAVPFCVNEWNNTHTCDDWQIASYNNELRNYRDEVEQYVQELQSYVSYASDYAQCEIQNLD